MCKLTGNFKVIRMAFTHETKPKMKKRRPIIKMEMMVSFFVSELTSTAVVSVLLMNCKLFYGDSRDCIFRKQ
jgi:hypothetical protein